METPKGDTAASAGKATEISSREAGEVSYIQPVFHPTVDGLEYKREQSGERDEQPPAMEVGKEAKEETALEVRALVWGAKGGVRPNHAIIPNRVRSSR